jgi:hypothetical protein
MSDQINTDLRFSIIPEWVLDADISDRAIRIYSILARYADNETLQAFPSRDTLGKRAFCNVKAVTKAIEELVTIGAVIKQHRKQGDSYQSNLYTLRRVGPSLTPPRVSPDSGVGSDLTPPRVSDDPLTITTELEPLNDRQHFEQDRNIKLQQEFNSFWEIYPRKLGKGEAKGAFVKAVDKFGADVVLEGVKKFAADPNLPSPQFVPRAATWLNQERWDDEPYSAVDPASIAGVSRGVAPRSPYVGGPREWVEDMHKLGEHFECRPGEFGCK